MGSMGIHLHDEIVISIRSLGTSGEGVGVYDGIVGFIDGALPGEQARVQITELKKNYFKANLLEILEASPDRVKPICPVFGRCGGCQLMHLKYEKQLEVKTQQVSDALRRIGGFEGLTVSPCAASPDPLYYRNKIQVPVAYDSLGMYMGLYARGSHDIIPVKKCYIHCATGEAVFSSAQEIFKKINPPQQGKVRHLLIRTAIHEDHVLVIVITTGVEKKWIETLANELMEAHPQIKGVVENINLRPDNVILGTDYQLIKGVAAIEENLCGFRFRLSPHAFFQVNTLQVENLYRAAVEMCRLTGNEILVDAYCGVGTMAIIAAPKAKSVVGIEYVADAIQDARYNASLNSIANARFEVGAAEKVLQTIPKMDVVLLNPPRKGCDEQVLQTVLKKSPRTVVYVSCNPATLARDLKVLSVKYRIESVRPFDMFPQTSHVETVVKLLKK